MKADGRLDCGCVYSPSERCFIKYCREHAMKILRTRFEKMLPRETK